MCQLYRRTATMVFTALAAFAPAPAFAQAAPAAPEVPMDLRALVDRAVDKVKPALVRIQVVTADFREGREQKYRSSGSGVIITKEGHVVTNHHVAAHSRLISVTLATKEEVDAELVGTDPLTDIAVIKLENKDGREYPTAEFGDSSLVRVGDEVLAMGSPMALSQSVTFGIVSNTEMIMPRFFRSMGNFELDGEDVGSFVRWIGHDAAIYGGNSGGPLVNMDGKVIGINEIDLALSGAIPSDVAKASAEHIMEFGMVKRGWLGITVQPLLESSGRERGVLVSDAVDGSPAAKAGLKPGDILVRVAGADVTVKFDEEIPGFNRIVAGLPMDRPVDVVVLRDGKEVTLPVQPQLREEAQPRQDELKRWGVTMRNISLMTAKEMQLDSQDGVLVTSVNPGGPSGQAKPSLEDDDVILEVGGKPVKNTNELVAVTEELTVGQTEPVPTLVKFERNNELLVTVIRIGLAELDDPAREVAKAWLPVRTQVITRDIAENLGNPELRGFRITRVLPGTAAETAGFKPGDLIVAVDGQPLEASELEDYEELPTLIRQYKIGTPAEFSVLRDGAETKISVELPASPKETREMKKFRVDRFDFTVRDITFLDKTRKEWETELQGVLVEEMRPGGWAEIGELFRDDLVLEMGGKATPTVEAFQEVIKEIEAQRPEAVVLKVRRGIHTRFLEFKPKWDTAD